VVIIHNNTTIFW